MRGITITFILFFAQTTHAIVLRSLSPSKHFNADGVSDGLIYLRAQHQTRTFAIGSNFAMSGTKTFTGPGNLNSRIATTGDFNGDKVTDLFWCNSDPLQAAHFQLMKADGSVLKTQALTASTRPAGLCSMPDAVFAADIDANGKADLIYEAINLSGRSETRVVKVDGTVFVGTYSAPQNFGTDTRLVGYADVYGSMKGIYLRFFPAQQRIKTSSDDLYLATIFPNDGFEGMFQFLRTADVDGDGSAEMIFRKPGAPAFMAYSLKRRVAITLQISRTATFTEVKSGFSFVTESLSDVQLIDAGDYNGDGIDDLMVMERQKYCSVVFGACEEYDSIEIALVKFDVTQPRVRMLKQTSPWEAAPRLPAFKPRKACTELYAMDFSNYSSLNGGNFLMCSNMGQSVCKNKFPAYEINFSDFECKSGINLGFDMVYKLYCDYCWM